LIRQQPSILIVRVGGDHHQAGTGAQFSQASFPACCAAVDIDGEFVGIYGEWGV
jgi:hypothetical protein